jgi:hypothetical protein
MSGQGAAIGAATGATYALATGKDPVKYAMIGGAVGGAGPGAASALGLGGTAAGTTAAGATQVAGTGSALTGAGASTAANTMFANAAGVNPATVINASQAAAPGTLMGASQAPGIFANPATYTPSSNVAVERSFGTVESLLNPNIQSSSMAPSFMEQVGSGASQLGKYAQQNPQLTNQAMQSAQQAMRQPEAQFAPAGQVNRGQIQPMDYMSLLNPQQGTVLRPQPISLLG